MPIGFPELSWAVNIAASPKHATRPRPKYRIPPFCDFGKVVRVLPLADPLSSPTSTRFFIRNAGWFCSIIVWVFGLEAHDGNGLEARLTHWLEASVTGNLTEWN